MSPTRHAITAFILCAAPFWAACSKKSPAATDPDPAPSASASAEAVAAAPKVDPAEEAQKYFKQTCVVCHGAEGKGNGPGAAALHPKPRDYTDAAWQASVTDEQLTTIILKGGAAVGKSPIMPGNPQLKDKPEMVRELVKIVRSFKK